MSYFNDNEEIKCPYCKEEMDISDHYINSPDEVRALDCDNCNKTFTVSAMVRVSYTVQCGDEDTEDCDYRVYKYDGKEHWTGDKKRVYAQCTRCEETNYVEKEKVSFD